MKARWMTAALAVLVASAAAAQAGQLVAVGLADGAALSAVSELGGVVRHVGLSEMLVEGGEPVKEALERWGFEATALASPRSEGRLYLSYPRYTAGRLTAVGEVLWSEPGGASVVNCPAGLEDRLRALSFSTYPLPESVDVDGWFDNRPPGHVARRAGPDDHSVRAVVRDVMAGISADSLMAHVEALAHYPGGDPRSRFVLRSLPPSDECLKEAKPYIQARLNEYLPAPAETDSQRFHLRGYTCDEGTDGPIIRYPADNIVGVLPGTGRLSGYYVVCAHYDATAVSDTSFHTPTAPPWFWWCENPAPGADDNATGVATVLEAARALSGLSFPFDIHFVFFSGEELGLDGSHAYADSVAGYRLPDSAYIAPPDTIYGVLNVDMIAYKRSPSHPDTCHIVTNPGSTWLADWIIETAGPPYDDLFPDFSAERIDMSLAYSDHAPFWEHDYDALVAIEHWNPRDRNVNYHTLDDVVSTVYPSQLRSTARMITGAMARLADPESTFNLAVFADDLVMYATTGGGTEYHTDHFVIGGPTPMRADFHAFGPDGVADVTLEVWDGPPDTGELVSSASFAGSMGGGEVFTHEFEWDIDESDLGEHLFSLRVAATGDEELTLSDNVVEGIPVRVDSPELFIADHFTWPNPATNEGELHIAYQLSRATEGSIVIRVFDLLGTEIAEQTLYHHPSGDNEGLLSGLNSMSWQTVDTRGVGLRSGVYVYQVTLYDRGSAEPVEQVMGKFAVVR